MVSQTKVTPVEINNPYKFRVYRTGAHNAGTIIYNNESFDTNNNYDTSTGRYTIPVTGYYQLNANIKESVTAAPNDPTGTILDNTGAILAIAHFVNMYNGGSEASVNVSTMAYLTAGQYVYVNCARALAVGNAGNNTFSGFLVSTS